MEWLPEPWNPSNWRYTPAPALFWKITLCAINCSGLYLVYSLKSDRFKKMFAKVGLNTDEIDEEQLKYFKLTAAIRVLKQNYWTLFQLNYGLSGAFMIGWPLIETFTDICTIWAYGRYKTKNVASKQWMNMIGLLLFVFGCAMETGHDVLLSRFKSSVSNKGKIFTDGFAKYVAYPNYSGYCVWRTGQALLSGNIIYSSIVSAVWYSSFIFSGIPEKEAYLLKKYGLQYQKYIKNRSKLIPGIY
eukprot:482553_1